MATFYMNRCLAQLENTEMYSKILFINKKIMNKFDDYVLMVRCSMAHNKACLKVGHPRSHRKILASENPSPHPSFQNCGRKLLVNI